MITVQAPRAGLPLFLMAQGIDLAAGEQEATPFSIFLMLASLCKTMRKLNFCTGKCRLRIEPLVLHSET